MKPDLIHTLNTDFEAHAKHTDTGIEFWLARDLQHLLGYTDWRNFLQTISKAKTSCEVSGHKITDHFADANKLIETGKGAQRQVEDLMLTRYACATSSPKTVTRANQKSPSPRPTSPSRPASSKSSKSAYRNPSDSPHDTNSPKLRKNGLRKRYNLCISTLCLKKCPSCSSWQLKKAGKRNNKSDINVKNAIRNSLFRV